MFEVRHAFEDSDTEFRYSRCIRQGGVEAPVLWRCLAKYVLRKAAEKWKARGWETPFGGKSDNEYVLHGMMWAGNCWVFLKKREWCVW